MSSLSHLFSKTKYPIIQVILKVKSIQTVGKTHKFPPPTSQR